jgi:hypothetical protein
MSDNSNQSHLAKTVIHGQPAAEIGSVEIEKRAREIAMIAGRDEDDVRPQDLAQAQAELEGRTTQETTVEDADSVGSMSRDPSIPPSFHDKPKSNVFEPNEQEELEHMVLDAVEEAQHDQMVEARKRRQT